MAEEMSFSVGAGADFLARIGAVKEAGKAAREEVRALREEIRQAKAEGRDVPEAKLKRLAGLEEQQASLRDALHQQAAAQKAGDAILSKMQAARTGAMDAVRIASGGIGLRDIGLAGRGMQAVGAAAFRSASPAIRAAGLRVAQAGAAVSGALPTVLAVAGPVAAGVAAGTAMAQIARTLAADRIAVSDAAAANAEAINNIARDSKFSFAETGDLQRMTDAAMTAALNAAKRGSVVEWGRGILGISPSAEATKLGQQAQETERARFLLARQAGERFKAATSRDAVAKSHEREIETIVKRKRGVMDTSAGYADEALPWWVKRTTPAGYALSAYTWWMQRSEEIAREEATLQIQKGVMAAREERLKNNPTDPAHGEHYRWRAAAHETAVLVDAVHRDRFERSMDWNRY